MPAYLEGLDPETFDYREYARKRLPANYAQLTPDEKRQARIQATRLDPLLWAILYFSKTISTGGDGQITFADMHFDLCRIARHFAKPLDPVNPLVLGFVAPRRAGKTTWLYKILMFWVAAHGHRKFFYVLTGTDEKAKRWITNFKVEMQKNKALQLDYPDLATPFLSEESGRAVASNAHVYVAASGFIVEARSASTDNLGASFDDERPDMILADDIEPQEGAYGMALLNRVTDNFLNGAIPMGAEGASVLFIGTVHMPGSLADQVRIHAVNPDPKSWISELGMKVRHYKPFVDRFTKEESISAGPNSRSFWPGRHKTEKLLKAQGSRIFAKQYANEPLPENGAYWRDGDIQYGTIPANVPTITAIIMDPALTTKKKSDFSAIVVIRFAPSLNRFEVLYGRAFQLNPGTEVAQKIAEIYSYFPEATLLVVEENAGGDWNKNYGDIPGLHYMGIRHNGSDGNKAMRAAPVLRMYQTGIVVHTNENLIELERELYSFPNGLHDDLPDAVCFGVQTLLDNYGRPALQDSEYSYV